jgi:hypothetical protein
VDQATAVTATFNLRRFTLHVSPSFEPPAVGAVTSTDGNIDCSSPSSAGCTATYPSGRTVTLQARTHNGSDSYFQGWGGDCKGSFHDCALTFTQDHVVGAQFSPMTNNVVFISAMTFPTNRGSAAAYDGACNQIASAAGINNLAGDAYVSWTFDSTSSPLSRLGSAARGFRRLDGQVFADTQAAINHVFHSISIDETGAEVSGGAMTGSFWSGGAFVSGGPTLNCGEFTQTTGAMMIGSSHGGPIAWSDSGDTACVAQHVYCFMKTKSAPATFAVSDGKLAYLTNGPFAPGGPTTPDAQCAADKPPGAGLVRALIATSTTPASAVLSPAQLYVRPDGQEVGTGAEIAAGNLRSGIWQSGDGRYSPQGTEVAATWTGSLTPSQTGATTATCTDWSITSGSGSYGSSNVTDLEWWHNDVFVRTCATAFPPAYLYCIEQ